MTQLNWQKDLDKLSSIPVVGELFGSYNFGINFILKASNIMSFPIYVFMHKNLGQRTYSVISITLHLILIAILSFGVFASEFLTINIIPWLFIAFIIYHRSVAYKYAQQNNHIHSRSIGEPWKIWKILPFGSRPDFVIGIYEPLFVIFIAQILDKPLSLTTGGISMYLTICGFSLFLSTRLRIAMESDAELDRIDKELEANYATSLIDGVVPTREEARGVRSFTVESANPEKQKRMLESFKKAD